MIDEERMRNLTPHQKKLARAYKAFHDEMMTDDKKMRDLPNVWLLLEDYFHLLRQLGIPIEPEVQRLKESWEKYIIKGSKPAAMELDEVLRQLITLSEDRGP